MTITRIELSGLSVAVEGSGYLPEGRFLKDGVPFSPIDEPRLAELLQTGLWCNTTQMMEGEDGPRPLGEPTEAAFLVAGAKAVISVDRERVCGEVSFSSSRKRMSVLVKEPDGAVTAHVKGAPEVVLARSTRILKAEGVRLLDEVARAEIEARFAALGEGGMRVLAVARRSFADGQSEVVDESLEEELTSIGLVGIIDPPRAEVRDAVRLAHDAGPTAAAIAHSIDIDAARIVTGSQLDDLRDQELGAALGEGAVFVRARPQDKICIVEVLHDLGHVVAMTGDGGYPGAPAGGCWYRHGHSRHGCRAWGLRNGAHRRQFRLHHRRGGGGASAIRQHP
ncbi:hypothetical protein [Breoghania sp.]|uniref:hypothetical protein n=1 Tax=Breoghania sp. TaxID=2065378 RepID=UPI0026068524|nr:hypothetical protein [Breoghania sp.]MDJ0930184.1 hypothetical protein [Breoghania sp.]